jgi:hypothetical protein
MGLLVVLGLSALPLGAAEDATKTSDSPVAASLGQ